MDKIQEWMLTPNGMLFGKLVATLTKCGLVWLSTKIPALGLGANVDQLVSEFAPVAALSIAVWWSKRQHDATMVKIETALNTPCPQTNLTNPKEGEQK